MSMTTEAQDTFETLVRLTIGDSADPTLSDLDPEVDAIEVSSDALRVFMGSCHCSLASPI